MATQAEGFILRRLLLRKQSGLANFVNLLYGKKEADILTTSTMKSTTLPITILIIVLLAIIVGGRFYLYNKNQAEPTETNVPEIVKTDNSDANGSLTKLGNGWHNYRNEKLKFSIDLPTADYQLKILESINKISAQDDLNEIVSVSLAQKKSYKPSTEYESLKEFIAQRWKLFAAECPEMVPCDGTTLNSIDKITTKNNVEFFAISSTTTIEGQDYFNIVYLAEYPKKFVTQFQNYAPKLWNDIVIVKISTENHNQKIIDSFQWID